MGRSENEVINNTIGSVLRVARQNAGMSLTDLANSLDLSKGYLSGVENNKVAPTRRILNEYILRFGVSEDDLNNAASFQVQPMRLDAFARVHAMREMQEKLHELKEIGYEEQPRSSKQREAAQKFKEILIAANLTLVWDEMRKEYVIADGEE